MVNISRNIAGSVSGIISGISIFLICNYSFSYPGKTDSSGEHYNRETGIYHKHNSPPSKPLPSLTQSINSEQDRASDYPVIDPPDFKSLPSASVIRVVDGDTVILDIDGNKSRVRLIGVDTPETVHPSKPVEYYGKEASQFTKNILNGEKVWYAHDTIGDKLDKYGRHLLYLYRAPDGLFVNLEIIRQGYGHAYTRFPFSHMDAFRNHERLARRAGKGLWAAQNEKQRDASTVPSNSELSGDRQTRADKSNSAIVYKTRTEKK